MSCTIYRLAGANIEWFCVKCFFLIVTISELKSSPCCGIEYAKNTVLIFCFEYLSRVFDSLVVFFLHELFFCYPSCVFVTLVVFLLR